MRTFSDMHDQLVKHEQDIIGHVAYSQYKTHKAAFIQKKKDEQVDITEELLHQFTECELEHIEHYRLKAEEVLQNFLRLFLIQQRWSKFWSGVSQSVVAGIILAIIAILIAFFGSYNGQKLKLVLVPEVADTVQVNNLRTTSPTMSAEPMPHQ